MCSVKARGRPSTPVPKGRPGIAQWLQPWEHHLTVRLPLSLYKESTEAAKRRNVSLNALVKEGLTTLLKEQEYERLYEAFGQLGEDTEEADVEYAAHAPREVVSRDER